MAELTVNPAAPAKDLTISVVNPVDAAGSVISGSSAAAIIDSAAVGDPDLAPGQKRDPNAQKSIYGKIPQIPTQDAVDGIKYDYSHGLRVYIPADAPKTYHVTFIDKDTGTVLFSADANPGSFITSVKKYYVRFGLIIHEKGVGNPIFETEYNDEGKDVLIQLPVGTVGDSVAWFSYVERFAIKHKCNTYVAMSDVIGDLFKDQYPLLHIIKQKDTDNLRPYATYHLGLFFGGDVNNQPLPFKLTGLHRTAGWILGLRTEEELADVPPRVDLSAERKIKEPYVCIAAKASSQCKYWNNPYGWDSVVKFLKEAGYRVLCIDRDSVHGQGVSWNHIPYGAEDFTGNIPLQERINLIKDADFFVGLSSGLSWIAWCCKVPVVLISGFTWPQNEFYTPYRVINYHTCTGCWHTDEFDHFNFLWCPKYQDNPEKQFECTKMISAEQVIGTIKTIPQFIEFSTKSIKS